MRKFIFGFMAVAFMGVFASCDGKSTTSNVENDSTAVDTVLVDSTAVDTLLVDSIVVDSASIDSTTVLN